MNLKSIKDLEKIEKELLQIRNILNPEDAPYICDIVVTNINDQLLEDLVMDTLIRMGYRKKIIMDIIKIVRKIQS